MSRKKVEINPIPGQRVKALLAAHEWTSVMLAEAVPCSPQHVSRIINGHAALTTDMARRLVEILPGTNVSWLLGMSEYPTETEKSLSEFSSWRDEWRKKIAAVSTLAFLEGFEIELVEPGERDAQEVVRAVLEGYKIMRGGKTIATVPPDRFNRFCSELQELAGLRLRQFLREIGGE